MDTLSIQTNNLLWKKTTHLPKKKQQFFSLWLGFLGAFLEAFFVLSKPVRFQGRMKWEMRFSFQRVDHMVIRSKKWLSNHYWRQTFGKFWRFQNCIFCLLSFFFTETHGHRNQAGALSINARMLKRSLPHRSRGKEIPCCSGWGVRGMGELMSVALVISCKGSNQDGSKYFLMLTI